MQGSDNTRETEDNERKVGNHMGAVASANHSMKSIPCRERFVKPGVIKNP